MLTKQTKIKMHKNKLCTSNIQWHRVNIPLQKGGLGLGVTHEKKARPKPSRAKLNPVVPCPASGAQGTVIFPKALGSPASMAII
jgi:hypothetical protein